MDCEDFLFSSQDEAFFNKIDGDLDLAFALSLQEQLNEEAASKVPSTVTSKAPAKPLRIIDPQWELIDPNPDIHALFLEFNAQFFYGTLEGVEVKWSPRMTSCAGVCSYEGRGGLCSVRLSLPLLKLRPRSDLVETLLHEMIHAYLFVTANNKDHDAHGPEFLKHMYRINRETGTKISVYHNFYDEVDLYRKHWWKCSGPCQKNRPFFGIVKRAMNRAPGPRDTWWAQHQVSCGGTFTKIKEPEDYKKNPKRKQTQDASSQKPSVDIKSFFNPHSSKTDISNLTNAAKRLKEEVGIHTIKSVFDKEDNLVSKNSTGSTSTSSLLFPNLTVKSPPVPFSGNGFKLGSSSSDEPKSLLSKIRRELGHSNSKAGQGGPFSGTIVKLGDNSKNNSVSGAAFAFPQCSALKKSEKNKLVQSSIDKFVTSPLKGLEKKSKELNTSKIQGCENAENVPCPVCSILLPNREINAHLDQCLLNS